MLRAHHEKQKSGKNMFIKCEELSFSYALQT